MLTDMQIKKAKHLENKQKKLYDSNGLYLIITPRSKRWYVRYTFRQERRDQPIGKYPFIGLLEARQAAIEIQVKVSTGIDPKSAQNSKEDGSITFDQAFEALFEVDSKSVAANTLKKRRQRYEKYIKAEIGNIPLSEITPQMVKKLVLPLHDLGKEETAKRVRIIIGQVFKDGFVRYDLRFDPSQAAAGLKKRKKVRHHPHIEDKRLLGRLISDIEHGNPHTSASVQFAARLLPYLFVRPFELRTAHGKDFDLEEGIWRVPATGKNRRVYLVPLPRQIISLLKERFSITGKYCFLFPSPILKNKPISGNALNNYLIKLGYSKDTITPHGFRGTASTILNEKGYKTDWIEAQLDHREENSVRSSYNHALYLKQRKEMMQDYADYLDELKNRYGRN